MLFLVTAVLLVLQVENSCDLFSDLFTNIGLPRWYWDNGTVLSLLTNGPKDMGWLVIVCSTNLDDGREEAARTVLRPAIWVLLYTL